MDSTIFAGKTLLITGGTGSFGNTVLRHFLSTGIGGNLVVLILMRAVKLLFQCPGTYGVRQGGFTPMFASLIARSIYLSNVFSQGAICNVEASSAVSVPT